MNGLVAFIRSMLTGADNQSADVHRVLLLVGGLAYVGLAIWQVVHDKTVFDYITYAAGFAALLTGSGAGLALKAKTEPGGGK